MIALIFLKKIVICLHCFLREPIRACIDVFTPIFIGYTLRFAFQLFLKTVWTFF